MKCDIIKNVEQFSHNIFYGIQSDVVLQKQVH